MKNVICEETARLCVQVYHDHLRAVVLTGSLARNEGTFVKDEQGSLLLGDAEFLLVVDERAPLPTDADLRLLREKLDERVRRRGLRAEIALDAVRPDYLRELTPSIFACELKSCAEIVAGDPGVLTLIPEITRADIPMEDGWRMLANRLVEQLESVDELLEWRPSLSPRAHYRTVKLYLDMATSLLVFVGRYAPTYGERARNLGMLVETPERTWPFRLRPFTDDVVACTQWKLSATGPVLDADRKLWERAIDYAQALWHWELARLQECEPDVAHSALMTLWMRRQPLHERLRGWAHIVRQAGWLRGWSRWPQWALQALHASPRYSVYEAATDLLFGLRFSKIPVANGANGGPPWKEMGRRLPLLTRPGSRNGEPAWRDLAADVLFNYREFLMNTRS